VRLALAHIATRVRLVRSYRDSGSPALLPLRLVFQLKHQLSFLLVFLLPSIFSILAGVPAQVLSSISADFFQSNV
jgi:hypothetical protein